MKYRLDMDDYTDEYFSSCKLLGIVSLEKNYRFVWRLNHAFNMDFRLNDMDEIEINRKDRFYHFPVYSWQDTQTEMLHLIYHNHNDGEYLLPQFRHIDFLWLIKGEQQLPSEYGTLISRLKQTHGVQLVAELPYEQLKNFNNLLI